MPIGWESKPRANTVRRESIRWSDILGFTAAIRKRTGCGCTSPQGINGMDTRRTLTRQVQLQFGVSGGRWVATAAEDDFSFGDNVFFDA